MFSCLTRRPKRAARTRESQRGFTLIELSIVLVLIGLIVGGVLKGQQLIASTRLKMTVAQVDATKAAVNTFQDKYISLPGDLVNTSLINATLLPGDGNGTVGLLLASPWGVTPGNNAAGNPEFGYFWMHLSASQLLGGVTDLATPPTGIQGVLSAKVSGGAFEVVYGTFGGISGHYLRLQAGTAAVPTMDILSPTGAAEIDRKYDDGVANTGAIQSNSYTGAGVTCTNANGVYAVSTAITCTMAFLLF